MLVGRIGSITRAGSGDCRVALDLFPPQIDQIPANTGAQVRAKTVFGEKWVELLYPGSPETDRIAAGAVIGRDLTIDPLEVETILNTALPLLDAIDPENLSAALEALATGFAGHEESAIRGIRRGIDALRPLNENEDLLRTGLRQLGDAGAVLETVDDDLLEALASLEEVGEFTTGNAALLAKTLRSAPTLLRELSGVFETQIVDLTELVVEGATVVGVLAARSDDLDRLLNVLPKFNARWVRNLSHQCRFRQASSEPGATVGSPVPGRCWRVHNLISESQGAYPPGDEPKPGRPRRRVTEDFSVLEIPRLNALSKMLYRPAAARTRAP